MDSQTREIITRFSKSNWFDIFKSGETSKYLTEVSDPFAGFKK